MSESLYGGKALENVTQALASCAIKEQCIAVNDHFGYPFLFNVHDENITEASIADATTVAHNTISVMMQPPVWAPNLPLGAEAMLGKSFMGSHEYTHGKGLVGTGAEEKYGVTL